MATGRILVVDDERLGLQELFRDALAAAGHATRTASSADEAPALLGEEAELLVTDMVMPGMDGVALVREARRRAPDLEAVAVTGRDDVRLAVQAMKAGCADFLMKPLEVDELVEVAERALGRVQLRREHSRLVSENLDLTRAQALYRQGLQILSMCSTASGSRTSRCRCSRA